MRTFTHAIVTAAVGRRVALGRGSLAAFIVGSVLPDLPLGVLTLLAIFGTSSTDAAMSFMDRAYISSPLWIALHNTPHSFVVMGGLSLVGYALLPRRWGRWLLWYAAGAVLHVISDILTHAMDGPMFLYPLSSFRFQSPISYWDPDYYGRAFTMLEYTLDALLLAFLVTRLWWKKMP